MGLRRLICLLPGERADRDGVVEEMEQPGTSYNNSHNNEGDSFANRLGSRKVKTEKVNCSNGSAQLFACFRAGAINLIVNPTCEMACQRPGASTVQPVSSLPRAAYTEDQHDGEDPTSPVVTCIGQVRKQKPNKTPPRATPALKSNKTKAEDKSTEAPSLRTLKSNQTKPEEDSTEVPSLRSLKSNRSKPEEEDSTAASKRSKWKQMLGSRGTVNPSQQTPPELNSATTTGESSLEFHIDLNRFASSAAQATPTFGSHKKFGRSDLKKDVSNASNGSNGLNGLKVLNVSNGANGANAGMGASKLSGEFGKEEKPRVMEATSAAGVPLWQRRSGVSKPMSLELKKRVVRTVS